MTDTTREGHAHESKWKVVARNAWLVCYRALDHMMNVAENNWHIIRREGDLFFGVALIVWGVMNIQSNKFCDGNGADYLSCTQPTTYYYYGALETTLVLIGTVFVILWFFKHKRK